MCPKTACLRRSSASGVAPIYLLPILVALGVWLGGSARARADDGSLPASPSTASLDRASVRAEPGLIVVTAEDFARHRWRTVTDVLQHQSGLHVSQAGGIRQRARLCLRGQASGGVLLRLDGIEITDPLR